MAINKVEYGGETLIDLTSDSVTPETLANGVTAHDASGAIIVGTATPVQLVQSTGSSEGAVMSQKAVTDAIEDATLQGERGTGMLVVTTQPSGYTTVTNGYTPKYRIALSTVKTQSGVNEVLVGDTIRYSYYVYLVGYVDATYAYMYTRTSIRGATGADYVLTDADKVGIAQQAADLVVDGDVLSYVTPQMYGAKGDGSTDDTAAIQAALDASSIVLIPDGTYMINATHTGFTDYATGGIHPKSNQTIIMSNNATLRAMTNSTGFYNVINMIGVENVRIIGGKVEGERGTHTGTYGEFGYGVAIRACTNVTVDGVESFNHWGDSVFIGYDGDVNSENVKIYNCVLHSSRRQGISVVGGINVIIRDCEIYNINGTAPQSGIDIEPDGDTGVAKSIFIMGCYIHDCASSSLIIADVANPIETIRVSQCTLDMLNAIGGDDLVFDNNKIVDLVTNAEYIIVTNCDIKSFVTDGGSGNFNNCRFTNSTNSDALITIDCGRYPAHTTDKLSFDNCYFKPYDTAIRMMLCGGPSEIVDNKPTVDTLIFTMCDFEIGGSTVFANGIPAKNFILDGCSMKFTGTPYSLFTLQYKYSTKMTIRDTVVTSGGAMTYLADVGSYSDYEIEIYNSKFLSTRYFIWCPTDGKAGGTIRLCNTILNSTTNMNSNTFTFEPIPLTSADKTMITNFVLNALPVYTGGVS